ncbi:hypothetical protein E3Q17_03293 [Wallemia mellicola]|uniref:Uncharacterized protein n=1 Tax=Wallemia mellicola TaxID=1708541 RepID=A0A4V4MLM4_9BASI|nr:hypothetical protein E3Q17_03293 [Wallemia mellicola]
MKRQSDTYLAALRAMEQAGMREANHFHLGQPRYSSVGDYFCTTLHRRRHKCYLRSSEKLTDL